MSWVKLDDHFPDNPKIAELSDAAFRAYVTSICYSARELTDGIVPLNKAKEYAGRGRVVQELVPGLWEPREKGFAVHDFLKYNPTREQVMAEREAARRRMETFRRSGEQPANIVSNSGVGTDAPVNPVSPSSLIPEAPDHPQPPPSPEMVLLGRPNIFRLYEELFGKGVNGLIAQRLKEIEKEWPSECVQHCFQEAAESNARNIKLVYSILERHRDEGCFSPKFKANPASRRPSRRFDG